MGLSEEEKRSIVVYRLAKARETLDEISILIENELWRFAANRLYYACYYAASALLVNSNHETKTHSGVKNLLSMFYVKEGKIDKELSRVYGNLFNMRQKGDYEDWSIIEEKDVIPFLEPAEKFIETIENLINTNN